MAEEVLSKVQAERLEREGAWGPWGLGGLELEIGFEIDGLLV